MGGWKYVVFWLVISLVCGAWLLNKNKADRKGLAIWQETNNKLDKIIELMQK
jgi:hypothetical protein